MLKATKHRLIYIPSIKKDKSKSFKKKIFLLKDGGGDGEDDFRACIGPTMISEPASTIEYCERNGHFFLFSLLSREKKKIDLPKKRGYKEEEKNERMISERALVNG